MAETVTSPATKRCAVVTGANKGIGFELCRQLASNGVLVVLTARDEKKGFEAVENLKGCGLSDVVFHQLDVTDSASVASLAHFMKTHFGKLDILVNNAGIGGFTGDYDAFKPEKLSDKAEERLNNLFRDITETYELAKECLETNYYGTKRVTEALVPLLQLSNSATIVNVSSTAGLLKNISNERAMELLSNIDELTEENVDELLKEFLKDYKDGLLESKGWPGRTSAYIMSKATMNTYTRFLANKFPSFRINSICPGYVKTDINFNTGILSVEEGAKSILRLALLPNDGPSGLFFRKMEVSTF